MTRSVADPLARCACIDIGSNTTRLLVAEGDGPRPRELLAERAFTRLGAARDRDGAIAEQKVSELAAVVARQVAVARTMGAGDPRIVATSAVRGALNAAALCAAVKAACGIAPEILSGEDEARLAFSGAIGMLASPPSGIVGVVDVGGGSTELVVGTVADGVTWSVSLPLGSSGVTDSDLPTDPPSPAELLRLRATLAQAFAGIDAPRPSAAYAVGGSATSLQRLVGSVLSGESLTRGLQALVTRPSTEIALALGLHAERARLLPAGLLLLDAASRAMGAPLQLAGGGLREGVVIEQLARLATTARRDSHRDDPAPSGA
jgi:exopolyphosphatase/guanosine-5'-triphosphate,3'-diphosphate pyrophosphatase